MPKKKQVPTTIERVKAATGLLAALASITEAIIQVVKVIAGL
jgi:hypothetical protein